MKIERGIAAALGAAVLFGLSTPIAKILLANTTPLLLAGILYTGSGIGLAIILAFRSLSAKTSISWPHGIEVLWLLGASVIGGAVAPYLLLIGLQLTDAASASLILNLEGVFTVLLAWFLTHENFDRRIAIGMALTVSGGVILSLGPEARTAGFFGTSAIVLACLAWAIDNNLTRKVSIHDPMFIACVKGFVAGPASIALALRLGAQLPPYSTLVPAALIGFLGYGLSLSLFILALRHLGTARTGAYFSLAPFIGATLAVGLGAPISVALLLAGILMGAGIWLHIIEHHEHEHRHEFLEHEHSHRHDDHHQHAHGPEGEGPGSHSHLHRHDPLQHTHPHYPDSHHRHLH